MRVKTSFKKWIKIFEKNDGWDKVLSDLPTAAPGTRAWPNQSKDHKISFRIDYGAYYIRDGQGYRNLNLQANKGTKNPTAAAVANADSHKVVATVPVLVDNPPTASQFANALRGQLA